MLLDYSRLSQKSEFSSICDCGKSPQLKIYFEEGFPMTGSPILKFTSVIMKEPRHILSDQCVVRS